MPARLALLPASPPKAVIARRGAVWVTRAEFECDVAALAAQLPRSARAMNLCLDRYWFAVSLFACMQQDIVSVLPNSAAPAHLAALCTAMPDLIRITDHPEAPLPQLPCWRADQARPDPAAGSADSTPLQPVPADRIVARVYTSGSTGTPQPHDKTLGSLWTSVHAAARRIWPCTGGACSVLGTAAFRHMYGLESSVLLPLLAGGVLASEVPFYPADVVRALAELPEPRLLVTTPFHLRTLLDSGLPVPPLGAVLSATAPLAPDLAERAQRLLAAPVLEIYGATEAGQIATRAPCSDDTWQTLDGFTLAQQDGATFAHSPQLPRPQVLGDVIELTDATHFRLVDRTANMINVVGKRSSLAFLNHVLTNLPGVRDGSFCMPAPRAGQEATRLAAFVVAPGLSAADILAGLRPQLDPVFLPRPIVMVDALPRDTNGKLLAATLNDLMGRHL